jgi:hypothetical protein
MSFPLYYFLFLYGAFLVAWFSFASTAIFHMLAYGFKNAITVFTTLTFIAVSIAMLGISYFYLAQVDWNKNVTVFASGNVEVENINFEQ